MDRPNIPLLRSCCGLKTGTVNEAILALCDYALDLEAQLALYKKAYELACHRICRSNRCIAQVGNVILQSHCTRPDSNCTKCWEDSIMEEAKKG